MDRPRTVTAATFPRSLPWIFVFPAATCPLSSLLGRGSTWEDATTKNGCASLSLAARGERNANALLGSRIALTQCMLAPSSRTIELTKDLASPKSISVRSR